MRKKAKQLFYEDVVADVTRDFAERQQMRRPYELSWQLNMNFLMGNQYCNVTGRGEIEQEERFFFWQEKQVFNHIAPILDIRVSRLNKVRPQPIVRPAGSGEQEKNAAKVSTEILKAVAEKLSFGDVVNRATMWSEVCGTSFYKVTWDEKGEISPGGGARRSGDVNVTVCPPFEIFPDSNVSENIEDCRSVIHARAYSVRDIKRIWGKEVKGEKIAVFSLSGESGGVGGLGYNSAVPSVTRESKEDHAVVIERYTRPDEEHENGTLEIVAGDQLLYFGELPYVVGAGGRGFPFVRQVAYGQAGCFWGASVIERIIPVQRAYNALKNRKHEFINRLSMGILTVEDGSVDTDDLEEEGLSPGKILVYRQGSDKPSVMDGGNIPVDFREEENKLLAEFSAIAGVSDLTSRSEIAMNSSGVALQIIAEQDEMRMAASIDSIRQAVRAVSKRILLLYKQFATSARLLSVSGTDKTETLSFSAADISDGDVVFEADSQLADSMVSRKTFLLDLLKAGLFSDGEGKLAEAGKRKILAMLGFADAEEFFDTPMKELHSRRAENENLDPQKAEILPVDDHATHIERHTRFVISGEADKAGREVREEILRHIEEHRKQLQRQGATTDGQV